MTPRYGRAWSVLAAVAILVACSPTRGCVESQFDLAPDSRLPKWFSALEPSSRSNYTLSLQFWTNGDAVFTLADKRGLTLQRVTAPSCWHPATRWTPNGDGSFTPAPYPHYVIVVANEVVDVVEARAMQPTFWMSENETIIREAEDSIRRGECRHSP